MPDDVEVRLALGQFYVGKKQYAKAAPQFARAVAVQPDNVTAWNLKGACASELRLWRQAADDYTEAIRRMPDAPVFLNNRGIACLMLAQWDRAAQDFGKAARLEPDNAFYHRDHALACLAAGRLDDYRAACAAMFQRFQRPANGRVSGALIWGCTVGPQVEALAGELLKWTLRHGDQNDREKSNAVYLSFLGRALYRAGQLEAARDRLEEARRLRGKEAKDDGQDCLFLAMIQHRLGHPEPARQEVARARAAYGQAPEGALDAKTAKGEAANARNWVAFTLLCREAEGVLKGGAKHGDE